MNQEAVAAAQYRRIVLAQRPQGLATKQDFRLETASLPEPADGQMRLRTLYLSLDPYMRGRMSEAKSYAPSVAIGETMCGATVCKVEGSRHAGFKDGDIVLAYTGWQEVALSDGEGLAKLEAGMAHPSWALGVLGMPGFTAYVGLLDIGAPKAGETVVVAAASGAVGSIVGQIAKLKGCRAVGIAGGAEKCEYVVKELGFDACIDHHQDDFADKLREACPQGIDVYFENVGGAVLHAVVQQLNDHARMPVCGLIAWYNLSGLPAGEDHSPTIMFSLLRKRVKMQGFIIFDHYERRHAAFFAEMSQWLKDGKIKVKEDVLEGLQSAPGGLLGLLRGDNFGKLVVRVAAG